MTIKKISKSLLACVLSLCVFVSCLITTSAIEETLKEDIWDGSEATDYAEGSGLESDPFIISTANELALLAKTTLDDGALTEGKYYKLTADIVINKRITPNAQLWYSSNSKSWSSNVGFKGNFDGNGHTISGIYILNNNGSGGLFWRIEAGATVKNVGIINSSITANRAGAIAGEVSDVEGKVADIQNCYSGEDVTVQATSNGGGIVGGVAGTTTITNCYSLANITAPADSTGGIAGQQWSKLLKVIGCYTNSNAFYGSASTWETATKSYCVTDTLTADMMKGEAAKTNMPDLDWNGAFITTDAYPVLKVFVEWNGDVAKKFAVGDGTENNPFEISNASELALLAKTALDDGASTEGKYYKLTNDIVINTKVTDDSNPKAWFSHYSGVGFSGNFDGDGHTVSGIYISSTGAPSGLFSRVSAGATIKNVGVINSSINGSYTGAIVGQIFDVSGKTAVIENCYSGEDVTVQGKNGGGGIVGGVGATTTITNCYSLANITAPVESTGGIAGEQWSKLLKVIGCYTNSNALYGSKSTWKTATKSYCVTDTLIADMMKGEAAKTNMPDLDWVSAYYVTSDSFPKLCVFEYEVLEGLWDGTEADKYAAGDGTRENPYQISNGAELAKLANDTDTKGKYYELTADIYLNDTRKPHWKHIANPWYSSNSIGTDINSFSGHLSGNNHTIYGLYINNENKNQHTGLFKCLSYNAVVLGVNIDNAYLKATFVGAIAGREIAPTEGRIKVANCFIGSNVELVANGNGDSPAVGGVIGRGDGGIDIVNCGFTGTLTNTDADRMNGIAGDIWTSDVSSFTNCYVLDYHISRAWIKIAFANVYTTAEAYNCYNKADITFVSDEDSLKGDNAQETLLFDFDRTWQTNENSFPTLRECYNYDVNLDGFANEYDVAAIRKDLLGVENTYRPDANEDGKCDVRDLVKMANYCKENEIVTLKVLSIGNSFSQHSHRYLSKIASSAKDDIKAVNLYIGGCSLEKHWSNFQSNASAYDLEVNGVNQGEISISEAFAMEDWDVITFQQASSLSDDYNTYQPYLENLVNEAKKACDSAEIYIHETWSYVKIDATAENDAFKKYNSSAEMHAAVKAAYEQAADAINAPIIPTGDVIQNLRDTIPEFDVENGGSLSINSDDGMHLSEPYGKYVAGLVWYGVLSGKDVREVKFVPNEADKDIINTLKNAVYEALS